MAVVAGPLILTQAAFLWSTYVIDRRNREATWAFIDYVHTAGRSLVVLFTFLTSLMLYVGLIDSVLGRVWSDLDNQSPAAVARVMLSVSVPFVLAVFTAWLVSRWIKVNPVPVPPELAQRLAALGGQLGLVPRQIRILPTRGGKIADACIRGTRRGRQTVLLTDYLVQQFTAEEIELLFAHTVARVRLGHLRARRWILLAAMMLSSGLIFGWFFLIAIPLDLPSFVSVLPAILIVLASRALVSLLSRKQAFAADAWAAKATGRPEVLADALERLGERNGMNTKQSPLWLRVLLGHPMIAERVASLRGQAQTAVRG